MSYNSTDEAPIRNLDIETACIVVVNIGRETEGTLSKCSDVNDILKQHEAIDSHVFRPFPGDEIHAYARFSASKDVGELFKLEDEILKALVEKTEEEEYRQECYVENSYAILSLGETTRLGSDSLQFTGSHLKNTRFVHDDMAAKRKIEKLVGVKQATNINHNRLPIIITGIIEIDGYFDFTRRIFHDYTFTTDSTVTIKELIVDALKVVRKWLTHMDRKEKTPGFKTLGYKCTRQNNDTSYFDTVISKLNGIYAALKAGSPGAEIDADVNALGRMAEAIAALDEWTVARRRYTTAKRDLEELPPEGPPRSMLDTLKDMHRYNEDQISGIEATNRLLGGFSLTSLIAVFAMLYRFTFFPGAFRFFLAAVSVHVLATLASFLVLNLKNLASCFKNMHHYKSPPATSVDIYDYKKQRLYINNPIAYYDRMYKDSTYKEQVKISELGLDVVRRVTRSAFELAMLKPVSLGVIFAYFLAVLLYVVSALVYLFIWL